MNKNIFINLDKVANGLILACSVTYILLMILVKDYFHSPILSWCIGICFVCFAINVIVTVVLGRKKNADFWFKTVVLLLIPALWIAIATGVIN